MTPLELEKSAKAISQLKKVSGKAVTRPLRKLFRNMTPKITPRMKYPEKTNVRKAFGSMSINDRRKPYTVKMSKRIK